MACTANLTLEPPRSGAMKSKLNFRPCWERNDEFAALQASNFLAPGTISTVGSSTGIAGTFCCARQERAAQGAGKTQRMEAKDGIWEISCLCSLEETEICPRFRPDLPLPQPSLCRVRKCRIFVSLFNIALFKRGTAPSYTLSANSRRIQLCKKKKTPEHPLPAVGEAPPA